MGDEPEIRILTDVGTSRTHVQIRMPTPSVDDLIEQGMAIFWRRLARALVRRTIGLPV